MNSNLTQRLGIEFPIFAFSHCRDVVAAVSRAGGFGVLGAVRYSPEQLELELSWIDEHVDGRPYGIDVILPASYEPADGRTPKEMYEAYRRQIPSEHWRFVGDLRQRLSIPEPTDADREAAIPRFWTGETVDALLDVAFKHPIALVANALGPPPPQLVERAHDHGALVAGLVGRTAHAVKQAEAGCDIVVAQSYEAGGHTGDIGSIVLIPDVVDAVSPIPVLAAGGIATGRQMAAALALGAAGVWTGSVWLTTKESDVDPEIVQRYLAAGSEDTVRSTDHSGKPARKLRTPWTDAWSERDAPPTLPSPLQSVLAAETETAAKRHHMAELVDAPVGQVVGRMTGVRSSAEVLYDMVSEYLDVIDRLARTVREEGEQ